MTEKIPNLSQACYFKEKMWKNCIVGWSLSRKHSTWIGHNMGMRHMLNFFYRYRSGPLPNDISSCPPCAHLNQDSTLSYIIASENSIQGRHPLVVTVVLGVSCDITINHQNYLQSFHYFPLCHAGTKWTHKIKPTSTHL